MSGLLNAPARARARKRKAWLLTLAMLGVAVEPELVAPELTVERPVDDGLVRREVDGLLGLGLDVLVLRLELVVGSLGVDDLELDDLRLGEQAVEVVRRAQHLLE